MREVIARTKVYIALLLSALVIVTFALALESMPVSSEKKPIRVLISQGATARVVSDTLIKKQLIRSRIIFLLTCSISGSSEKLKPGVYELSRSMNMPQIIRTLVEGNTLESWVTIPEGKTLREIADILEEKQLADSRSFLDLTTSEADQFAAYPFIPDDNMEGYLFPDTYLVERGTTTENIVKTMLDTFEKKVVARYSDEIEEVGKKKFGLGEDNFNKGLMKILTVASLVEREAKIPADRQKIAAVIWNRLAKNMRLDIDATVTYSLGESRANKAKVYYKDLHNNSPYNTYLHSGLPPAPICNPGLASIKATLEPAHIDALYYVAKPDGSHIFSKTLQEHDAAIKAIKDGKL